MIERLRSLATGPASFYQPTTLVIVAAIVMLGGIFLFAFPGNPVERFRGNLEHITVVRLAFTADEMLTITPKIARAIETVCTQRSQNCDRLLSAGDQRQSIEFVDFLNTVFYPNEKRPLYFLNQTYVLSPRELYIDGNGNFRVNDSTVVMYGTNYIEFGLYIPYNVAWQELDISLTALNSRPPPIEFDIITLNTKLGTLRFDKGDDSVTTNSQEIALPPGYHNLRIWFANDLFDQDNKIDRNAYIKEVVVAPRGQGFGDGK